MPRRTVLTGLALVAIAIALAHRGAPTRSPVLAPAASEPLEWIEIGEGLRIERAARLVEFDARVAIDAYHPQTPDVYLELVVTGPDSREHESLLVTRVPPSLIHSALLAIGADAGRPGRVEWVGDRASRVPPTGTEVGLELIWRSPTGQTRIDTPSDWISPAPRAPEFDPGSWRFAGSRLVEAARMPSRAGSYEADLTGVIVGLTTFGSEVIAPERVVSHESAIDEPPFLARRGRVPTIGTPVKVRISLPAPSASTPRREPPGN